MLTYMEATGGNPLVIDSRKISFLHSHTLEVTCIGIMGREKGVYVKAPIKQVTEEWLEALKPPAPKRRK